MSGPDIQLEKSKHYSPVLKKIGNHRWRNTTGHILHFFQKSIRTNGLVVKVSLSEFGYLGSIPDSSAILRGTEAVRAQKHALWISSVVISR